MLNLICMTWVCARKRGKMEAFQSQISSSALRWRHVGTMYGGQWWSYYMLHQQRAALRLWYRFLREEVKWPVIILLTSCNNGTQMNSLRNQTSARNEVTIIPIFTLAFMENQDDFTTSRRRRTARPNGASAVALAFINDFKSMFLKNV